MNVTENIDGIINKIISIPKDYNELDKSIFSLVIESGYLETFNQITEQVILEHWKNNQIELMNGFNGQKTREFQKDGF